MRDGQSYLMATPEKALTDLLYLYPQYNSSDDLLELRLDDYFMHNELNLGRLREYAERTKSDSVQVRIKRLITAYDL